MGARSRRRPSERRYRSRCTFDGAEESIQAFGLGAALDSGTLVVSCWFQIADAQDGLLGWGDPLDGGDIALRTTGAGKLYVAVRNDADTTDTEQIGGITAVTDSAWHHVWIVWEQTQVSWWLDGVQDNASQPAVDALIKTSTTVDEFILGARHRGASPYLVNLNGTLANVVFWTSDPGAAVRNRILAQGRYADPRWADPQHWFPFGAGDAHPTVTDVVGSVAGTMVNMAQGNLVAP